MIPLAKDTRESIGAFAERVENRSLLFEKMVFSKSVLHDVERFDDAQRFNVLRATHEGDRVLQEESISAKRYAGRGGRNAAAAAYKAEVSDKLSSIRVDNLALADSRIRSNNRLLLDLEESYSGRAVTFVASLGGRLLINMAGGVMENSGLALDRITGLPFIPGSAVKGIARHCALWEIHCETNSNKQINLLRSALAIFGFSPNDLARRGDFAWAVSDNQQALSTALNDFNTDTYKGICSFIAGQPSSTDCLNIVAEVLTPHYNNNLRPIFFPAVEAGSEFGFAIIAQREIQVPGLTQLQVLEGAKNWLQQALTQNGIGAKTGAGYGWFRIDPQAEEKRRLQLEDEKNRIENVRRHAEEQAAAQLAAREAEQEEAARRGALTEEDAAAEDIEKLEAQAFAQFAKDLANKELYEQRAFFTVFLGRGHKETRKRWKKRRQDLWDSLTQVAQPINIDLG